MDERLLIGYSVNEYWIAKSRNFTTSLLLETRWVSRCARSSYVCAISESSRGMQTWSTKATVVYPSSLEPELSVTDPFIPFLYRGFDLTRVVKMPYDILNRIYYELTYD